MTRCIIERCPVQDKRAGCGYHSNGLPCEHPAWREQWKAATAELESFVPELAEMGAAREEAWARLVASPGYRAEKAAAVQMELEINS